MASNRKKSEYRIKIPEGIVVEIYEDMISAKKNGNESVRKFKIENLKLEKQNDELVIYIEKTTKKEKKLAGTIKAHIKNMFAGLEEPYVYKLQVCFVHFPISVSISSDKKFLAIKNFLGESRERKAKILPGADVKIEKDIIEVSSYDKEIAGQTAANIETATRIKAKDKRVFQDGIYIIKKANEEI